MIKLLIIIFLKLYNKSYERLLYYREALYLKIFLFQFRKERVYSYILTNIISRRETNTSDILLSVWFKVGPGYNQCRTFSTGVHKQYSINSSQVSIIIHVAFFHHQSCEISLSVSYHFSNGPSNSILYQYVQQRLFEHLKS